MTLLGKDIAHIQLILAEMLFKKGFSELAYNKLEKALHINPYDYKIYATYGEMLLKEQKYPLALEKFKKNLRFNPHDSETKKQIEIIKKHVK